MNNELNQEINEYLIPTSFRPNDPLALETLQTYRLHLQESNPGKKYVIKDNQLFYITEEIIEFYPQIDNRPTRLQTIDID